MNPVSARATAATVALVVVIAAQAFHAYETLFDLEFHLDAHFLLEAAHNLLAVGVGTVTYLPHSTEQWDVVLWSYYLPVCLYAALLWLTGIEFHQLAILWFIEFLAVLGATFLLVRRWLDRRAALVVTAILFLDPQFLDFAALHYHAMSTLLVFAALATADAAYARDFGQYGFAAAAGFLVGAATLAFVAVGLPAAVALSVFMLVEKSAPAEGWPSRSRRLLWFLAGGLAWVAIFVADVALRLDPASLRDLLLTLAFHYSGDAEPGSLAGMVVRAGYFVAGVVVPPQLPTLLPVLIGGVLLVTATGALSGVRERRLLHLALALIGSWLVLGMLLPRNIYVPRMASILPPCAVVLAMALQARTIPRRAMAAAIAAAFALIAVGVAYHAAGRPWHPYGVGLAAAAALVLGAVGGSLAAWKIPWASLGNVAGVAAATSAVLLIPWSVAPSLRQLAKGVSLAVSDHSPDPVWQLIGRDLRPITDSFVVAGDRVLTNAALPEYFPPGVRRQLLRHYRGLTNGATATPADRVVLIGIGEGSYIDPGYDDLRVGVSFYFQGFTYCIERRVELVEAHYALLGRPGPCPAGGTVAMPAEIVSPEKVRAYLDWRAANGLAID